MTDPKNIAILLLAAGSSSRLGHPKQLVEVSGQPLLQKMVEISLATGCHPVVIVLGAYFEKIKPVIENLPVHILENKNWESGMGSTVSCGMDFLINNYPELKAVILLVCDQYYLAEKNITELIRVFEKTNKNIIASKYGETVGVPALFSKHLFTDLLKLNGQSGAKKIVQKYADEAAIVEFSEGMFDLDTEEDLKN
ncbi:MAG: nucleotidyltransferase family protein [Saprospiraceae bacterium]